MILYDAVDVSQIPRDAEAVAGYVNGHWPTFYTLQHSWPRAHRLSITVTPEAIAHCLDVEIGDASPESAPGWIRRALAAGVRRPVLYHSLSGAQELVDLVVRAGIPRGHFRLWTAHYTGRAHLCGRACGLGFKDSAGATQYTDRAMGRNLDASWVMGPGWFRQE